jgi:hypothetical protein
MTWERTGFEKLKQALGYIDFHVMAGRTCEGLHTTWSFDDIVGTLEYFEDASIAIESYNNLWAAVLHDIIPTEPDIAGLIESEKDNKTMRMY